MHSFIYRRDVSYKDVPFFDGPFPTDNSFEVELFHAHPLDAAKRKLLIEQQGLHGTLGWRLMHPQVLSRPDLAYIHKQSR